MKKGIFLIGTGTDVGKTYVSALLVKALCASGLNTGYYKAAISGAPDLARSDAGYVKRVAGIPQPEDTLVSYLYHTAVSPHLAARLEGNPVELMRVAEDFHRVKESHDFVVVEGSGGILCPVRDDAGVSLFLEDIIKALGLDTLLVADAGLGAINAAGLTAFYLKQKQIPVTGLLLNRFNNSLMHTDNRAMIERLTGLSTLACIPENADCLSLSPDALNLIKGV